MSFIIRKIWAMGQNIFFDLCTCSMCLLLDVKLRSILIGSAPLACSKHDMSHVTFTVINWAEVIFDIPNFKHRLLLAPETSFHI